MNWSSCIMTSATMHYMYCVHKVLLQHKFRDEYAISLNQPKTKKKKNLCLLPLLRCCRPSSIGFFIILHHDMHRFLLQLLDPKPDNLKVNIE
jgi:hypothetical protein